MGIEYETEVIGEGNHASLLIPDWVLNKLKTHKRAPLKITINGHTYQSTATGVAGECRVVFPLANRQAAGVQSGHRVKVSLELDSGYREVPMPGDLLEALKTNGLLGSFSALSYSKRKELARQVSEVKTDATRSRRLASVIEYLTSQFDG